MMVREKQNEVVIIGSSDVHGNVLGYLYEDAMDSELGGLDKILSYANICRKRHENVILIDNGDIIQGNILADDIASEYTEDNPIIRAMNIAGYDAMTLGNHEFNWGISHLKRVIKPAKFPILAANVLDKDGTLAFQGHTIFERSGLRLALIGVVSPNVLIWDKQSEGISDFTFKDAAIAVRDEIAKIGKADAYIVSAHMGLDYEYDSENLSDSAKKIVKLNPEITAMLIGHKHIIVNERIGNTIIAAPRNSAEEVAEFHIYFDEKKRVISTEAAIIKLKDIPKSGLLIQDEKVRKAHEKTLSHLSSEKLGYASESFYLEEDIKGIPGALLQDNPTSVLIRKLMLKATGADIAASPLFRPEAYFEKGDIYYHNVFSVYKVSNTVVALKITGKELKAYMEWCAGFFNTWKPGDINISFKKDFPHYKYDTFSGIDYLIDLSKPEGERIAEIKRNGVSISPEDTFLIAVTSYRYLSNLKAQNLVSGEKEWESSYSIRDMMVENFRKNSPIYPEVENNFRITGIDLYKADKRREEIRAWINEGKIPVPYNESYCLDDYERLKALAGL